VFRKIVPFLIIIVTVFLFFYKLAFTNLILARGDTFTYFYPYWGARDDAFTEDSLPLWTSNLFMGAPLLANPQLGTLYPPNWLTFGLSPPDAIRISVILHIIWATIGAYLSARRALNLERTAAFTAAIIFGLGGHIGAHVEQINQLQGLAWMPWLFLLLHLAHKKPLLYLPLMGVAWGLQLLSGHAQVAFISGVGLLVYGLAVYGRSRSISKILKALLLIVAAGIIGILIASPQLIPAQVLSSLSNRGDGLNSQEATAFSLNPFLFGRGLLPSYDSQPFSEYVTYIGVIGLGLMIMGALTKDRRRWGWTALVVAGIFLALGRNNPLYLPLASLPGFNLFRVPARWLALYALGAAMLCGLGVQMLLNHTQAQINRRYSYLPQIATIIVVGLLAASTLLSDRAADEVDGQALPTITSFVGWGAGLVGFLTLSRFASVQRRFVVVLILLVTAELWIAARFMPHDDLSDPAAYDQPRFAANLMRVFNEGTTPPGRLLSITGLLFDPGDKGALESRWDSIGISERAARYAFTATKMQETLAPNLPLTWGIPSVDGFGGGLLPTLHYTQFTSLLLPDDTLRTVDGRLREVLAQPRCRGVCLPDDRWLDLMNVQYILMDKVYDLVHDGIFYDTGIPVNVTAAKSLTLFDIKPFQSTDFHVLYTCLSSPCPSPTVTFDLDGEDMILTQLQDDAIMLDGLTLARYTHDSAVFPEAISLIPSENMTVHAMTLVDNRTGDFVQLTPPGWERVYSADVKIYENLDVMSRAFFVQEAITLPDTYNGSEQALEVMRDPNFDPRQVVVLHNDETIDMPTADNATTTSSVQITAYEDTHITLEVTASTSGFLILTDAYYPGWKASIDGENAPIYRANVLFRAVPIEAGEHTVILEYDLGSVFDGVRDLLEG